MKLFTYMPYSVLPDPPELLPFKLSFLYYTLLLEDWISALHVARIILNFLPHTFIR